MTVLISILINLVIVSVAAWLLTRRMDRRLRPARMLDEIRGEVQSLVVELNNTTDRNVTLLEDRVAALKALLDNADKRIVSMKREIERAERGSQTYNDIVARARKEAAGAASEVSVQPSGGSRAGGYGVQDGRSEAQEAETQPLNERVIEMHADGISPERIAAKNQVTVGEVELIISLSGKGGSD